MGVIGGERMGQRKSNQGKGAEVGGFLIHSINSREAREIKEKRVREPD